MSSMRLLSARPVQDKYYSPALLYRRPTPYLYAIDMLEMNGRDLRSRPLMYRKRTLRDLIPQKLSAILYVDHIPERGTELFDLAYREDFEGVVAKWRDGRYDPARITSWIKIKNPAYSQIIGRDELFEKWVWSGLLPLQFGLRQTQLMPRGDMRSNGALISSWGLFLPYPRVQNLAVFRSRQEFNLTDSMRLSLLQA